MADVDRSKLLDLKAVAVIRDWMLAKFPKKKKSSNGGNSNG